MKIKTIIKSIFLAGFLSFGLLVAYCINFVQNFKDINKLLEYRPVQSTKVYDRNGVFVTKIGEKKQFFTPLQNIPQELINAFISAEDKSFYTNLGFDFQGNVRAVVTNIKNTFTGQRYSGASTITQQVVRNVLLSSERTLSRKIKEVVLSLYITQKISKDKIMETYLNHIFLGHNAYGVAGAASVYFDKKLDELNLAEIATLAGLPKSPSVINPFRSPTRTISRRNWILSRMKEDGFINEESYKEAKKFPLETAKRKKIHGYDYVEHVKNIVMQEYNIQEDNLGADGYSIYLDMDLELQKVAQKKLDEGLRTFDKRHGYRGHIDHVEFVDLETNKDKAIAYLKKIQETEKNENFIPAIITEVQDDVVKILNRDSEVGEIKLLSVKWARKHISYKELGSEIKKMHDLFKVGDVIWTSKIKDNLFALEQIPEIEGGLIIAKTNTGEVLSMIGGYGNNQAGRFNRAIQAKRQLGSIVKPFVYLAGLENGVKPSDLFLDYDKEYDLGNGVTWMPQNHNKRNLGKITMRKALEKSVNTVTIRITEQIGLSKVIETIKKLNIAKDFDPNLGMALGNFESTLHDVLRAYGVVANKGKRYNFSFYKKLEKDGQEVELLKEESEDENAIQDIHEDESKETNDIQDKAKETEPETDDIVNDVSAYQILNILEGAVIRGTARRTKVPQGYPIAAKTGTSNDGVDLWYVGVNSGVMIGIFAGFDSPVPTYEYGATVSLPIFNNLVEDIEGYMSKKPFKAPLEGVKYVKINRETGLRTVKNQDVIYEVFKESDSLPKFETEVEKEVTQEDIYESY